MMGWARWNQVVEGVAEPIHARAFVIADPEAGRKLAFVSAEICFITQALRDEVLARLPGWDARDVLLSATHTHSAPGGFSHHLTYNLMVPGIVPQVFETFVAGIGAAILDAESRAAAGRLRPAAGSFDPAIEVAFNRSLAAHNQNRDLPRKFGPDETHLAVDREMYLLRIEDEAGNPVGQLNWFSVHPINVHSDNRLITPDNKGYAAVTVERSLGPAPFVAAFAQGAAADVTPNFKTYEPRGLKRGKFADDFESARFNGQAQAELALTLFGEAREAPALSGELDSAFGHFEFVDMPVPPRFADGFVGMRTGTAAIGARMLGGTEDGRGVTSVEVDVFKAAAVLARARAQIEAFWAGADRYRDVAARQRAQGPKDVVFEPVEGKVLGLSAFDKLPLPDGRDPLVVYLRRLAAAGVTAGHPWTPHVLPLQLVVVGPLAIAALPAEFTTQAGRRLRASLLETLAERGVTRVQLTGYANAYSGYVTTPEEYDRQDYEGASTHFGRWTLGAYQAAFDDLARELLRAPSERPARTLRPAKLNPDWHDALSHASGKAWWREAGYQ